MSILDIENGRIFYETFGTNGEWVTIIAGHMRPSSDFRSLARFLVANNFRVLLFDNRGAGRTETPLTFSFEDMTQDIGKLWSCLNISQSHVVGFSMGGIIAQNFAQTNIKETKTLTLVSTCLPSSLKTLDASPWPAEQDLLVERLAKYVAKDFFQKNKIIFNAMAKQIALDIKTNGFNSKAEAQRNALRLAQKINLQPLTSLPITIIHGEFDAILSPAEALALHQCYKTSTYHMMNKAGHLLILENPRETYALIKSGLDRKL